MDGHQVAHHAGPLLLGYMLNWGLYGVLNVQVYLYWTAFPNDDLLTQTLVYGLYLLETAQTISLTHGASQPFVLGFAADPASLTKVRNLWLDTYVLDALVALVFQVYFANRIHTLLPRSKIIPGTIVLLSLTQFASGIAAAITLKTMKSFAPDLSTPWSPIPAYIWNASNTTADILIAVTMVYALSQLDTTFRRARNLVRQLSRLAMETGSLIAIMSLLQPSLFLLFPKEIYAVVPALVTAKLYSNSLLATLNARISINGARGTTPTGRRTSVNVAANLEQNNQGAPIPLSVAQSDSDIFSSWVPSTFPSRLDDTSYGLTDTVDSKIGSRVATEPQIVTSGTESRGKYQVTR
ncbi:hypothetical protein Moror_5862 [Moniliophthora roreri MCA 2997]|uniref:DUF6534 domain-containing protein n=1 Tax=Moniliophthora roreri (strain MCA 2997) TaxID=1381753 RepID=V2X355_MONRO|nr:hypothetical protein Moror_5862 [Moniliophthora roreri MCA 2997]